MKNMLNENKLINTLSLLKFSLLFAIGILGLSACKKSKTVTIPAVTKSNFSTYHPCGVAVSLSGKIAVSTYEGDTKDGIVAIWNSYLDFNNDKPAAYSYFIKDPEAVAFDANNNLFIADTYDSKVYFTTDLSKPAQDFFYIGNGADSPTNPRGMTFDSRGNLYVMCENLNPSANSYVQIVSNPTLSSRTFIKQLNSDQSGSNALDVSINTNVQRMVTTDYTANTIRLYTYDELLHTAILSKTLTNAGGTLNAVCDVTNVYFTNASGYLVKWNYITNITKNIEIGTDGIYAPWGVAIYQGNNLLVADAAHHKVQVVYIPTAPWQ